MIRNKILACFVSAGLIFNIGNVAFAEDSYGLTTDVFTVTGNPAKENSFLGVALRTKYLDRWGTLISREKESLNDHLLDTARIAHLLVLIKNKKYGGNLNADRSATLAMYHDLTEIVTDDMPTPVKYKVPQMKPLYNKLDDQVTKELLSLLPEDFREDFYSILNREPDEQELWKLVKAADTMSALIKCLREKSLGNHNFDNAYKSLEEKLLKTEAPEVQDFMKIFLPAFGYKYSQE